MNDEMHEIDLHVGRKMRLRRNLMGMTQQALAAALGITFQQVQKYERGTNRVSASMLWTAAKAMEVAPGFFFEGLPLDVISEDGMDRALRATANTVRGRAMLLAAHNLPPQMCDVLLQVAEVHLGADYKLAELAEVRVGPVDPEARPLPMM